MTSLGALTGVTLFLSILLLTVIVAAAASTSKAATASPAQIIKPTTYSSQLLKDSIDLYMTARGQQFLSNHLLQTLLRNGISLSDGSLASFMYPQSGAPSPIDLNNLPISMQPHAETLGQIRDQLKSLLTGFSFNDPELKVTVNGISYHATITHLGVSPNYIESQAVNKPNTVVMDALIEIPDLHLQANSIRVTDVANPELGNNQMGVDDLTIDMSSTTPKPPLAPSPPLSFSIPLAISIDGTDHVEIEALNVQNNLALVSSVWNFAHPMHIPTLEIIEENPTVPSATQTITPNDTDIENLVRAQLPNLAKIIQTFLGTYVAENGTSLLNSTLNSTLNVNTLFQEVNTMSPPGAPTTAATPAPYIWGLAPDQFSMDQQFLSLKMNSFITDPQTATPSPLPSQDCARSAPDLTAEDPTTYDIALQVDEGFVNRLLQLSFLRGYFTSIPEPGAEPIKLVTAPIVVTDGTQSKTKAKMHVTLLYKDDPTGILQILENTFVVSNPLQITLDMEVDIQVDPKTNSVVLLQGPIDVDSAVVDPKSIKLPIFKSKVLAAVRQSLTAYNTAALSTPTTLTNSMTVPTSIAGVPIQIHDLQADPSGNFMLYLQYGGQ